MANQDFTSKTEQDMLDWYFTTGGAPTRPTTWYVALYTVLPTANDGSGGTECSNAGYSRQSVTLTRTGSTLNPTATVTFGPATENWTEVVGFGIYSASTAGDCYGFKALTTARTLNNGDSATFATSDLSISLD